MNPDNRVHLELERLREQEAQRKVELIARWRRDYKLRTGEESTCTDAMALLLAELASSVGRLA